MDNSGNGKSSVESDNGPHDGDDDRSRRERGELGGDETILEGKCGCVSCVGGKISNCKFEEQDKQDPICHVEEESS